MYNILLLTTGAMELNCCSKWWCWRKWADINADTQMNAIFCNLMSTLTRASTGRRPFNFLTAEKWRKWFQTYFYIWLLWTHIKSIPFCLININVELLCFKDCAIFSQMYSIHQTKGQFSKDRTWNQQWTILPIANGCDCTVARFQTALLYLKWISAQTSELSVSPVLKPDFCHIKEP